MAFVIVLHLAPSHESHADIYDPFNDEWKPRVDMVVPRHHPSTVLLPDGRILILAGHSPLATAEQLGTAQYIDPAKASRSIFNLGGRIFFAF